MPQKNRSRSTEGANLQTALKVFAREGYRDSTSLIASECNISRPTIYQYFKDKEDIYYYAVKLVSARMFNRYATYAWSSEQPFLKRLTVICTDIMQEAHDHEEADQLGGRNAADESSKELISTDHPQADGKLSILFKRLLNQGMKEGQIITCDE